MKRIFILILTLTPILVHSQSLKTSYIDNRLKDYIFDIGTYWVNEKEADGTIDSLVVTNIFHGFTPEVWVHGEFVMDPVEYYQMYYESKTLNYSTWIEFIGYVIVREGIDWGRTDQYIFLASYHPGDSAGCARIVMTYDTLALNGFEFHKVSKILVSDWSGNNRPTIYYFAKRIGIIRKEILSADKTQVLEAWNLKSWYCKLLLSGTGDIETTSGIEAFPNPTSGLVHLRLPPDLIRSNLKVYDMTGNPVYQDQAAKTEIELDLGALASGVYILVIENDISLNRLKVIKN